MRSRRHDASAIWCGLRWILWDVDDDASPPTMAIYHPTTRRIVSLRIESPGLTRETAEHAAIAQLDRLNSQVESTRRTTSGAKI
jgi:hypothetical protein